MTFYEAITFDGFVKVHQVVTPAKAGVQKALERLDSRLRGNDRKVLFLTSYEFITFGSFNFCYAFLDWVFILFRAFEFWSLEFVSDFEFRASDLVEATVGCVLGVSVVSVGDYLAGHRQHV